MKKCEELWSKIRNLIRLITNYSDDYDEKCVKTKFNSNDDLPVSKTLEIRSRFVRSFLFCLLKTDIKG